MSLISNSPALPDSDDGQVVPPRPLPSVKPKKQYHAFLTHNWGDGSVNHERVKQIWHALKSMGLNLWFDEERMSGANVIQEVISGIDQSDVVVVFVTTTFCQKVNKPDYDNCKIEFMYAVNRMLSSMVAVPLDEDVLNPQSWIGPVGAILGCNLYPAKFWDNGAITPQRPEFVVQVQKLYDRIVSLCQGNGDGSSSVVSNSSAVPASGDSQVTVRRQFVIPKKRTHHEFFLAQRIKFCYKVALHA
jgi:TIR domain